MKSTFFVTALAYAMVGLSVASPVADLEARQKDPEASCDGKHDCCFSSKAACFRQYGTLPGQIYCPLHKYCFKDYGIPRTECNADCCGIKSRKGRGCPGK